MNGLKINFCGLEISSPIILASSPLTEKANLICEMGKIGVGAAITKSIATREIPTNINGYRRSYVDTYGLWACSTYYRETLNPRAGEELIKAASKAGNMPIIASVCGLSLISEDWYPICDRLIKAGASAIQIDLFYLPQPITAPERIEELKRLCEDLKSNLPVPLIPKLNIQIPAYLAADMFSPKNASGLSLLDSIRVPPPFTMSAGQTKCNFEYVNNLGMASLFGGWQYPLTLHYTSILSKKTNFDLCVGGGVWKAEEVFNLIAYGAKCVQIAASGIHGGINKIAEMVINLQNLLHSNGIDSVEELWSSYSKLYRTDDELGDTGYKKIAVTVDLLKCKNCNVCRNWCFCDSIDWTSGLPEINHDKCEGCGFCVSMCPNSAFEYTEGRY